VGSRPNMTHIAAHLLINPAGPTVPGVIATLRQFGRFAVVGLLNTGLSLVTYIGLLAVGTPYLVASALGFCAGAVTSYVVNRAWTFRAGTRHAIGLPRYLTVALCGLGTNVALLWLLVDGAELAKVDGQLLVIPFVAVLTFTANRRWTFVDGAAHAAMVPPPASRQGQTALQSR
jgi:putative flippase GtrA